MRIISEVIAVSGAGALIYGIQQWSVPAAWVIGGLAAVVTGWTLYPKGGPE